MKRLFLTIGSLLATSSIALSTYSINGDYNNVSNNQIPTISYYYNGQIYSSKDQIYTDYMLKNKIINQKQFLGDLNKSIIDFDSNMINTAQLREYDVDKIYPVYIMPNGEYEIDYEKATKANINPSLVRTNYTDGFNNYFNNSESAKISFGRKIFDGDIATVDFPRINGESTKLNPLSPDDQNYIKENDWEYLANGGVPKNNYERFYFHNEKPINNFYDLFGNLSNEFRENQDNVINDYEQFQISQGGIYNQTIPLSTKSYRDKDYSTDSDPSKELDTYNDEEIYDYASNLYLTETTNDIYGYRWKLAKEIQNNIYENNKFDEAHSNVSSGEYINTVFERNKSSSRYKFMYIKYEDVKYWGPASENDGPPRIIFNNVYPGKTITHVLSEHGLTSGYLDRQASNFNLYFKDTFTGQLDSINIYANTSRYYGFWTNHDFLGLTIMNNSIFNKNMPVWGNRKNINEGDYDPSGGFSRSLYPFTFVSMEKDWGPDNEGGRILDGFTDDDIYDGKISDTRGFYDGRRGDNGKMINIFMNQTLDYLNNYKNQSHKKYDLKTYHNDIYMSKYDIQKNIANGGVNLNKYLHFRGPINNGDVSDLKIFKDYRGQYWIVGSMRRKNYNAGYDYHSSSSKWGYIINQSFKIKILYKKNWLGNNEVLKNEFKALKDIIFTNNNVESIFNYGNFDSKKPIESFGNNSISFSYSQFKKLISGDTKNIYLKVVSNRGYITPYKIDFESFKSKYKYFINLFDSQNIIDKSQIVMNLDLSKLKFINNKTEITGINFKWHLKSIKKFDTPPISLDIVKINNAPIKENSLNKTIYGLLARSKEYGFSQKTKDALNNMVGSNNKISEYITYKGKIIYGVDRNSKIDNSLIGISFKISNDLTNIDIFKGFNSADANKLATSYKRNYLVEFKNLLVKSKYTNSNNIIFDSYINTLRKYIINSSIEGILPNGSNFKLPDLKNILIGFIDPAANRYIVNNQYTFNGSILTSNANSISKDNLYGNTTAEKAKIDADKRGYIDKFIPPKVTRLYDLDGREFSIDTNGSFLYDTEDVVIENARIKASPKILPSMVFYEGLAKPILNKLWTVFEVSLNNNKYFFKDYISANNFIKGHIDKYIQIIGGNNV